MAIDTLGEKLKNYRTSLKLTQADLGKMLNVSQVTIANYERGERFPKQKTLLTITKIFGVSLDTLLDSHNSPDDSQNLPREYQFDIEQLIQILLKKPLETALAYTSSWKSVKKLDLISFYEKILIPVLIKTGNMWFEGKILVSEEHMISDKIRELILIHSNREWDRIGITPQKDKGWMGFCAPGEKHELALLMNAQVLRLEGWHVYYLGIQVPFQDLEAMIKKYTPHILGISVTMAENMEGLEIYIQQIKDIFGDKIKIILGGHGASKDSSVNSISEGLKVAEQLISNQ